MNTILHPDPIGHPTEFPDFDRRPKPKKTRQDGTRRATAGVLGFALVAAITGLVGFGMWSKSSQDAEAEAILRTRLNAVPSVRTITAKAEEAPRTIELTGNMAAFDSATLFARATGYIGTRNVDIGSKVHRGDVLAVIAAPDLDNQLSQGRAQ